MIKQRAQLRRLKVKTKPHSPNYHLVIIKTGKLAIDVCWHQKWFNFCVLCLFSSTSSEKILVINPNLVPTLRTSRTSLKDSYFYCASHYRSVFFSSSIKCSPLIAKYPTSKLQRDKKVFKIVYFIEAAH